MYINIVRMHDAVKTIETSDEMGRERERERECLIIIQSYELLRFFSQACLIEMHLTIKVK